MGPVEKNFNDAPTECAAVSQLARHMEMTPSVKHSAEEMVNARQETYLQVGFCAKTCTDDSLRQFSWEVHVENGRIILNSVQINFLTQPIPGACTAAKTYPNSILTSLRLSTPS